MKGKLSHLQDRTFALIASTDALFDDWIIVMGLRDDPMFYLSHFGRISNDWYK